MQNKPLKQTGSSLPVKSLKRRLDLDAQYETAVKRVAKFLVPTQDLTETHKAKVKEEYNSIQEDIAKGEYGRLLSMA